MPKGQTHTTEQTIKALRMVDEGVRVGREAKCTG